MHSAMLLFSCLVLLFASTDAALPSLAQLSKSGLWIGSAANIGVIDSGEVNYTSTLAFQFNLITPENCMKWAATEPSQGQYTFQQGDQLVQWGKQHNQIVRGHNLCWGQDNPSWLTNGGFSGAQLKQFLADHITTTMKHFGNNVYCWDVVNEAVSDNPTSTNIFKNNVWYPAVPDYVDFAFTTARAAYPGVKLFYNDYSADSINTKSTAIYNMIQGMKQRGIPIDGIGLQMHISTSYYPTAAQFKANVQRFAALGLEVHITEMDVAISGGGTQTQQAYVYAEILQACIQLYPSCKSFEVWGFTDKHSWESSQQADIFDTNYNPKPAFYSMVSVLENTTMPSTIRVN